MSNYSKLYWLTRLDNLQALFTVLLVVSGIILFIYYLLMIISCQGDKDDLKEYSDNYGKYKKFALRVIIPTLLISTILPSKDEVIFIVAGGKTMDFVQSDSSINKIPAQTTQLITKYLDEKLKEGNK